MAGLEAQSTEIAQPEIQSFSVARKSGEKLPTDRQPANLIEKAKEDVI